MVITALVALLRICELRKINLGNASTVTLCFRSMLSLCTVSEYHAFLWPTVFNVLIRFCSVLNMPVLISITPMLPNS